MTSPPKSFIFTSGRLTSSTTHVACSVIIRRDNLSYGQTTTPGFSGLFEVAPRGSLADFKGE
jgi:hypothetical protein